MRRFDKGGPSGFATQQESLRLCWGNLHMDGHVLSHADSVRMTYAYAYWICLIQDTVYQAKDILQEYSLAGGGTDFDAAWQALSANANNISMECLSRLDVQEVQDVLKASLLTLRHLPTRNTEGIGLNYCHSTIKRLYKQCGGSSFGPVWGLERAFITAVMLSQDSNLFRLCNDVTQYLVRITLQDISWVEEKAMQDYVDFEEVLHNQTYDLDVVQEVASIWSEWLRDFDTALPELVDRLPCEHGYGATAEVRRSEGTAAKYHNMVMTLEAYYLAKTYKWQPLDHIWPGLSRNAIISHSLAKRKLPCVFSKEKLICEYQLVPKGINKKRGISKEPTTNQFFQKLTADILDEYFQKHPEMHINLHNQDLNRQLALIGSVDGAYATIDLSNASDSVTWTLVKLLCQLMPNSGKDTLLRILSWCRTTRVRLPSGQLIELEKYAPMGSATCFPIECMVFSAICAAVMKRHGKDPAYRVYGDDIVVPHWAYDEVMKLLRDLHFEPNDDKSYGHMSQFTESCGIECFHGHDVSPIRISRWWDPVARLTGLSAQYERDVKVKRFNAFTKLQYPRIVKKRGREEADLFLQQRKEKLTLIKQKWEKRGNIGIEQLESFYKMANECTDRMYYYTSTAIQAHAEQLYTAPLWSLNHYNGFFTSSIDELNRKIEGRWHFNEDIQEYTISAEAVRATVEPGEDDLRYSKMLEAYEKTHRRSLSSEDDLITSDCGAARIQLKRIHVPYRVLISYDCELENSHHRKEDYYVQHISKQQNLFH